MCIRDRYKRMKPIFLRSPEICRPPIGIPSAEVMQDVNNESNPVEQNPADELIKQTLKEKLSVLSREEIDNLKSQIAGSNREALERVLEELFSSYPPEPIQGIDETSYMLKLNNLQAFMSKNYAFFTQYALDYQNQLMKAM
eukprot:TRINITY_DN26358_c0_g1_i1.p1 TRINITY_DN26358_c0_g1~~TRINITY_DN26358_c0_g1_i1.p1  ORF type:complete len:152 (-),score=35.03 TRINITY_DN26358_c0_g1_i1:100-522(-)